jgi:hypothetical protein
MNVKKLSALLLGGVVLAVLVYAVALVALTWPVSELSIEKSGVFGDSFGLLTSLFSGLAFAGLIITIVMQKDELAMQREELKLQRSALESQVKELQSMSRYSALDQVRSMIDSALSRLSSSGGETTKPEQFFASMMPGPEWKVLIESTNPEEVMQAYKVYSQKNGPASTFVSAFSNAAKFYLRSVGNEQVDYKLSDNEFVVINQPWLKEIPYLSTHLQSVVQFAETQLTYEPAHKMFMLAFLVASQKMTGIKEIIKEGSIEELVDYLKKHEKELPTIAQT